jgi:hypothetical protein
VIETVSCDCHRMFSRSQERKKRGVKKTNGCFTLFKYPQTIDRRARVCFDYQRVFHKFMLHKIHVKLYSCYEINFGLFGYRSTFNCTDKIISRDSADIKY